MVKYTDKLVDKLEALGLRENTLIIFTGDNGTYKGMESQLKAPRGKPRGISLYKFAFGNAK